VRRIESIVWVGGASELGRLFVLPCADPERDPARIRRLCGRPERPPVVALVRAPAVPSFERALAEAGAAAVLETPAAGAADGLGARLVGVARELHRRPSAPRPLRHAELAPGLVGDSPAMRRVMALATRAAGSSATVLLTGETGTGKEVVAKTVHRLSRRREQPFLAVNCAAFPDALLESELFGYVKGAFTGADRDRAGLFERASGGTLFLDEVGETAPSLQAKLLRVLQEREVRRVGDHRSRAVDVRLVAATNRDLRREAREGGFREDLYYRLAVFPLPLPALRDRRADILPLVDHFIAVHGARDGKDACRFMPDAENLLLAHSWPGNVRELENEVQRALALAEPGEAMAVELLSDRLSGILEPVEAASRPGETLRECMDRVEAWYIRHKLVEHDGRKAATARTLGITREGLYKKMKRLGIE